METVPIYQVRFNSTFWYKTDGAVEIFLECSNYLPAMSILLNAERLTFYQNNATNCFYNTGLDHQNIHLDSNDVLEIHQFQFPNCPSFSGETCTNVPREGTNFYEIISGLLSVPNVNFLDENQNLTAGATGTSRFDYSSTESKQSRLGNHGNQGIGEERRPEILVETLRDFDQYFKRCNSFTNWPFDHPLSPSELSMSGFYYQGTDDCVSCFKCGGGIRNWEEDDDVWVEHARWFPRCSYLCGKMGHEFVNTVQDLYQNNDQVKRYMVLERLNDLDGTIFSAYEEQNLCHFHFGQSRRRRAIACKNEHCPLMTEKPFYPQYSEYNERCKTMSSKRMALAGYFYYYPCRSYVCYYCGDIQLICDHTDNVQLVLMKHARSSPFCDYIRSRCLLSERAITVAQYVSTKSTIRKYYCTVIYRDV
ncbi:baculoviral IAP repeat-containing protein 1a-like isoform X1 [Biomphalaria glabrata]|uniref:Baculoviral IAP repeat-containing protein 1a-like isoform X1 n=3 Tax=Biomphalaria glabrata TaxID=6526 RepID=A0A9W3A6B2_BIOGL|nr:baculoviral IAP repeat-containing protein 1a-like isoform X1 [Biomphalaria glabrata]